MKFIKTFILFLLMTNIVLGYDFIYNGQSLTYDRDELKFYDGSRVMEKEELQDIFSDREIILISQFQNREYTIKKKFFEPKKILLLNDTKRTFHLFKIYPQSARYEDPEVTGLITLYGKKDVKLKHFGGDKFTIKVK